MTFSDPSSAPWTVFDIEPAYCAAITILLCQICGVHSATTDNDDYQYLDDLLNSLSQSTNEYARMLGDICQVCRTRSATETESTRSAFPSGSPHESMLSSGIQSLYAGGAAMFVPSPLQSFPALRTGFPVEGQELTFGQDATDLAQVLSRLEGSTNEWEQMLLSITDDT